jgi:soluble lytic murein transglycosylase-like protein
MIQLAAKKQGVDPKLAQAIARAESDYSPNVVSSAGAVGVMQLMPDTAASLGVSDIHDPRQNIDGGVQYLKQMLTTFNGDVSMAVAAYNAGPQAVKNYNGVPPYSETQGYVQKVLSYYGNS